MGRGEEFNPNPEIQWDSKEQIIERDARIRDNEIYISAGLMSDMQTTWEQRFEYIKTKTDVEKSEVWVHWTTKDDPDGVSIRRVGTTNSAFASFLVPLKKMSIDLPENRQLSITPTKKVIPNLGTVFVFSFVTATSMPRNRKEEAAAPPESPAADAAPSTQSEPERDPGTPEA